MQDPSQELSDVISALRQPATSTLHGINSDKGPGAGKAATSVNEARRNLIARFCAPDILFVHSLYEVIGADAFAAVLTMAAATHLTMSVECPPPLMPQGWDESEGEVTCMVELLQEFRTLYNPLRKVSTSMWIEVQLRPIGRGSDKIWVISQMTDHYTLSHVASLSFFASISYLAVFCIISWFVGSVLTPLTTYLYPSLRGQRTYRSPYAKPGTHKRRDTPIPMRRANAAQQAATTSQRGTAVGNPSPLAKSAPAEATPAFTVRYESTYNGNSNGWADEDEKEIATKGRRARRKSVVDEEGGHARYY